MPKDVLNAEGKCTGGKLRTWGMKEGSGYGKYTIYLGNKIY